MRKQRDNRGGYRPGAGRKGEWKSGKTKAVKLPEKLVDEIITLARAMDDGHEVRIINNELVIESNENESDSVSQSNKAQIENVTESSIESVTESKLVKETVAILTEALALKPYAGGAIKAKIREALRILQPDQPT